MLAIVLIYFIATIAVHDMVTSPTIEANLLEAEGNLDNDIVAFLDNNELGDMDYDESNLKKRELIFPGTKWCGMGNIARNDEDFGFFERTDRCCYEHDHCPEYMGPGVSKYGLTNDALLSRMQCDCEEKFHKCLKSVDTFVANLIGSAYFNVITTKCYKEEYPIIRCQQHTSFLQRCKSYELDTNKPKSWQWFDLPIY